MSILQTPSNNSLCITSFIQFSCHFVKLIDSYACNYSLIHLGNSNEKKSQVLNAYSEFYSKMVAPNELLPIISRCKRVASSKL